MCARVCRPRAPTPAAYDAMKTVMLKIDDYFARCRLAAFDARALTAVNRQEVEYLALAAKDLTITATEIAGFPLARIEAHKPLLLQEGLNPAWADAIGKFRTDVIGPLLGEKSALSETDWATISARFIPYEGWFGSKAGAGVQKVGLPRVREILS